MKKIKIWIYGVFGAVITLVFSNKALAATMQAEYGPPDYFQVKYGVPTPSTEIILVPLITIILLPLIGIIVFIVGLVKVIKRSKKDKLKGLWKKVVMMVLGLLVFLALCFGAEYLYYIRGL